MIPVFGNETRRKINLGGASTATDQREILRRAREERQERQQHRRRLESAIKLQAWWRGIGEAKRIRRELRQKFESDPMSISGLRCLVLMGHEEEALGYWSAAMVANEDRIFAPFSTKDRESWLVLLRQTSFLLVSSVARQPRSQHAVAHLTVLNALLDGREVDSQGTQVTHSVLEYLLQRNLYPLLAQAIHSIPLDAKGKSTPSLPLIIKLATTPLVAIPQDSPRYPQILGSLMTHIFTISLLPNRLPLASVSLLVSRIPWPVFSLLRPLIPTFTENLQTELRIHLIANLYMFTSPHLFRLSAQTISTYLKLLGSLLNSLPMNAIDPVSQKKSSKETRMQVDTDMDSEEEDDHGIVVNVVETFDEPPPPKLDPRTTKRLKSIADGSHITTLFEFARKGGDLLYDYVIFLLSLSIVWPSQRSTLLNTVAGLGSGGIIRLLYREYVLRSQIGVPGVSLSDTRNYRSWPPLLFLTDLYSQTLMTMGDDEFYADTGATRNPLQLDELRSWSRKLLNIAVTLYWREEYTLPRQQLVTPDFKCPWETVRQKVTQCLLGIHARDSRKPFVPRDHWLVDSQIDLQSFVEAAVLEDRQLLADDGTNTRQFNKSKIAQISPRLGILNNIPFAIPFETRVRIFREFVFNDMVMHGMNMGPGPSRALPSRAMFGHKTRVQVRREMVSQDGFDRLAEADLKQPIEISFIDQFGQEEAGIDGGGVFKEFLTSLCKEVFDTDRGLWLANKENELYPNPHSYATEAHSLNWYRFIGRILGKAMYEGILIDVAFAGFFLAKWLDRQSILDDLASLDPELYNGLIFLKHYTGNLEDLSLNFTVAIDDFGVNKTVDLIPNGSETPVTKANRLQYIYLISHYRLSKQIRKQSDAFFEGLSDMIDPKWLRMFNQQEVQILLGGVNTPINLEDLRTYTNYGGLYGEGHPTIVMFWKVVNSFNEEQRKALLRFVTSCSRPPLLGFKELVPNFSIRDAGTDELRLPTSSTCVNLLKLPRYQNEATIRAKLIQAITSNAGFDLS